MKINPFLIALIGGGVVYFLWRQRQAKAIALPQGISPENVPQEWIEMTPKGAPVIGTSNELYDILT